MTKELRKEVMKRSKLKNKYHKKEILQELLPL